jgi:hypothetical protein
MDFAPQMKPKSPEKVFENTTSYASEMAKQVVQMLKRKTLSPIVSPEKEDLPQLAATMRKRTLSAINKVEETTPQLSASRKRTPRAASAQKVEEVEETTPQLSASRKRTPRAASAQKVEETTPQLSASASSRKKTPRAASAQQVEETTPQLSASASRKRTPRVASAQKVEEEETPQLSARKKTSRAASASDDMDTDAIAAHNVRALAVRAEYTRVNDAAAKKASTHVKNTMKSTPIQLTVLLYSGRFSPPQNAHLEIMGTINALLTKPLHVGIISLGDGVKGNTMDSPIPFELKKKIFHSHRDPFKTVDDFENACALIRGNIFANSTRAFSIIIDEVGRENISSIRVVHFAGNKENGDEPSDDTKLSGVNKFLQAIAGDIPVEYTTHVVNAITIEGSSESVSASRVRSDARSMNKESWNKKYNTIYSGLSSEVYDAITNPKKQQEDLQKGYDIKEPKPKTKSKSVSEGGRRTRRKRLYSSSIFYKGI